MDPISIVIGLVVVAGIAAVVYESRKGDSVKPVATKAKAPVAKLYELADGIAGALVAVRE